MNRRLGRTDVEVPPIIWRIRENPDREMLKAAGGDWVFAPSGNFRADLSGLKVLVGIEADLLRPRDNVAIDDRLVELNLSQCAAIVLQGASADDVKSGWPFHRLSYLREKGITQLAMIEAANIGDAQWLVESSPAHAIIVPYGIADMSAAFRLLDTAHEVGTAILATRPMQSAWDCPPASRIHDLQLRIAEPRIAAAMEPLPLDFKELDKLRSAIANPISPSDRDALWEQFCAHVAPPPPLKGGHPPEYGA